MQPTCRLLLLSELTSNQTIPVRLSDARALMEDVRARFHHSENQKKTALCVSCRKAWGARNDYLWALHFTPNDVISFAFTSPFPFRWFLSLYLSSPSLSIESSSPFLSSKTRFSGPKHPPWPVFPPPWSTWSSSWASVACTNVLRTSWRNGVSSKETSLLNEPKVYAFEGGENCNVILKLWLKIFTLIRKYVHM